MSSNTLLPPRHLNLADYTATGGYGALRDAIDHPRQARAALTATDLTGLGGAHFPLARKIESLLSQPGPRVVVCNAAEDEPGSQKDRTLLSRNPHLVLEGLLIAAALLDATDAVMFVSESAAEATSAVSVAIGEVTATTTFDHNSRLRLVPAGSHYVAGEATAAVDAINGGPGKPTGQPPYPTERGVSGLPTLVANCETLANLPRLIRAAWSGDEPTWTRLATVTGDVGSPGVYEVDPTTDTFADLFGRAGHVTGALKGFQPGGPSSRFLGAASAGVLVDDAAVRAAGSQPGCFAVRVLAHGTCVVEICEEITGFFSREQCGQCPPCRMKTQIYHRTLQQVARQKGTNDVLQKLTVIEDFVADMPHKCSLIDMPTPPVDSAHFLFPEDFAAHNEYGSCFHTQPSTSSQIGTHHG
ncbi:NADH-quinone oxidoreductase subunit NuoF [soil metagenome]